MKIINLNHVSEEAKKYHSSGIYSCSESVFLALTNTFDISVPENFYGISSSFAAGGLCGSLCGASSGALMTIGLLFGNEQFGKDKTKNKAREIASEFNQKFIEKQRSSECRTILANYEFGTSSQHEKCFDITSSTAAMAAEIIGKELGYDII
ncbi:MAG: C-GCAxxG-C-C family (seleno)protein [Filifactoraceae bacterium]